MKIFSAIKVLENHAKLKCMSCEGEIVYFLLENGPSRPKQMIEHSRHSPVSIFNKLNDLQEMGIIQKQQDRMQRQTTYYLEQNLLTFIYDNVHGWELDTENMRAIFGDEER